MTKGPWRLKSRWTVYAGRRHVAHIRARATTKEGTRNNTDAQGIAATHNCADRMLDLLDDCDTRLARIQELLWADEIDADWMVSAGKQSAAIQALREKLSSDLGGG